MDCVFDVLIDWHYHTQVHLGFLLCYLPGVFIALHFIFRSVIHLSQFLWKLQDLRLYSFFFPGIWMSSCSSTICWKDCLALYYCLCSCYFSKDLLYCSVAQSSPTLCDPVDCCTPGFPVLDNFLEFAQTHVHWVGERKENESHSVMSDCLWI